MVTPIPDKIEQATQLRATNHHGDALSVMIEVLQDRHLIKTTDIKEAQNQRNLGNHDRAQAILLNAVKEAGGGVLQ